MTDHEFKPMDFENPSFWFVLEDVLKGLIGGRLLYRPYFKTFGLKGNERVLDFGCGGGVGSKCLAAMLKTDGHLTCVDTSDYWIRKATKRLKKYPHVECIAGDIRKLDIPDHSFDVISVIHVIHDIAPEQRQDVVNALCLKLKGDGTVYVRERIGKSHGMPIEEIPALFSNAGMGAVEHSETKSEYKGVFRQA